VVWRGGGAGGGNLPGVERRFGREGRWRVAGCGRDWKVWKCQWKRLEM